MILFALKFSITGTGCPHKEYVGFLCSEPFYHKSLGFQPQEVLKIFAASAQMGVNNHFVEFLTTVSSQNITLSDYH